LSDQITTILYLTEIHFGFGAIRLTPKAMHDLGITKPLLVSDYGIVEATLFDRLTAALSWVDYPTFLDTPSNPTEAAVQAAAEMYRSLGCDGLIACGGGSSIDLAKAVALTVTHPGPLHKYAAIEGGSTRITKDVAPMIAIPTTAGTGSEVGRAALITCADGRKLGLISPNLIPKQALCDPELIMTLPPELTAASGMDALSHCIETFLSPRINPPAEAMALEGVGRIWRWLEKAVEEPNNREARWQTMMGALLGGLTFQKGLGAVHGLSHALGAYNEGNFHHGLLNAIFLPPVLRYNAGTVPEKYVRLREAMGLEEETDLARTVDAFNANIGLPRDLPGGLDEDLIDEVAARAMADHSTPTNPRRLSVEDYRTLLLQVL